MIHLQIGSNNRRNETLSSSSCLKISFHCIRISMHVSKIRWIFRRQSKSLLPSLFFRPGANALSKRFNASRTSFSARVERGEESTLFPEISGGECERASKIPGNFLISRYFRRGINNSDSFGAVWTHWVEEILHN